MLNRDQIAHEYLLSGVATTVHSAFQLADSMIAEAQKRKNVERPAVVGDGWIRVEDLLPKAQTLVITYNEDGDVDTDYAPFLGRITRWQPMPQAPK